MDAVHDGADISCRAGAAERSRDCGRCGRTGRVSALDLDLDLESERFETSTNWVRVGYTV